MVDSKECLFCRIARGEIPAKKVYEDDHSIAFLDINPRNPGHTLVIPKSHFETMLDMPDEEAGEYFKSVKKVAGMVMNGVKGQGVSVASSNGQAAGQVVAHQHFHVIPRFANEGPVSLEGILPTKRMDEKALDQIVASISGSSPVAERPRPSAPEPSRPEPESMNSLPKPTQSRKPQTKKKKDDDMIEIDDEVDFDF